MHEGDGRCGVVEEVAGLIRLQLRIDHDYYGTRSENSEECADIIHAVRQGDEHPVGRLQARLLQERRVSAGQLV